MTLLLLLLAMFFLAILDFCILINIHTWLLPMKFHDYNTVVYI